MNRTALLLGLSVLLAAWLGPLPELAPAYFAAHMAMHVSVVAVAAPLIAAGLGGSRLDPSRKLPRLLSPLPASVLEMAVVWGWHAPVLHHASRQLPPVLALEQAMFLAVGLMLWLSAFGGEAERRPGRTAAGIGGLLLASMHMTLLGVLLALSPRALYPHGQTALSALSALQDQHLGGVLMLLGGGSAYMIGALVLLARLLRQPKAGTADAQPP